MSSAEEAVLVAVMEGRMVDAARLVADFLPGELRTFRTQVVDLGDLLARAHLGAWTADEFEAIHTTKGT